MIELKSSERCRWDVVSLGEVMLRFDPGSRRIRSARHFAVWEGGGEYNVARALSKAFGLKTAIVTGIPANDLGLLVEDLIGQGGVSLAHARRVPFDGIGRSCRQPLNFVEKGFGVRGALSVADRAHSATGTLKRGDIAWRKLFEEEGVRWFHTGGIFSALSETTVEVALEAIQIARSAGTIVSYDLNYRSSLWETRGRSTGSQKINKHIVPHVDVLIGNEEDFSASLGLTVEGTRARDFSRKIDIDAYGQLLALIARQYPNLGVVAAALREVKSATRNGWQALLHHNGDFYSSHHWEDLEIYDRVGGGDGFVSGMIYGLLTKRPLQECVEMGAAHGALTMTTPGDTSMVSLPEVESLMQGKGARIRR